LIAAAALLIALLGFAAFALGRRRALALVEGRTRLLHSRPAYYGHWVALWTGLPAVLVLLAWLAFEPGIVAGRVLAELPAEMQHVPQEQRDLFVSDAVALADGDATSRTPDLSLRAAAETVRRTRTTGRAALLATVLALAVGGLSWGIRRVGPALRARVAVERVVQALLALCSALAILVTLGIVLSLVFEALRFFDRVPLADFLFGLKWSPQTAIRADQVGSSGSFGAVPIFTGTLLITALAMGVAVPLGLLSAIHLSEYASRRVRTIVKPLLEVLAGIPTVVYGFFAALSVAPALRSLGSAMGLSVSSESALAAGVVMGVMIIPFVSSLSDDVISAVPASLREGSLALGATPSETIRHVVLPAALPGIVGAVLLAISRAIGETMIVVMAAGLAANLTANPLEAVTTVTVQIVTLLVGDQEFDSAKTLAAFALGLVLFLVTLLLNVIALFVVRRYREQYE